MTKIGRTDLIGDTRYETPESRLSRLEEVFGLVERWTLTRTKWEAFHELNAVNVPCGPIMDTKELLSDGDLETSGMIVTFEHPERGEYKTVGCPFTLSDSPVEITRSPLLSEHNAEILTGLLDWREEELERLTAAGAV